MMFKNFILLFLTVLFLNKSYLANAQSSLIIKDNLGNETLTPLNELNKITFSGGNINLLKNDGNNKIFALTNLRKITFLNSVTSISENSESSTLISLYPNPVDNELKINFSCSKALVKIFNIFGSIMFESEINSNSLINISSFANGTYVCQIISGNKVSNLKFVKQ